MEPDRGTCANRVSDFSIDHILNRAGSAGTTANRTTEQFSWLQCTRYCPPKVPRNQKRDSQPQKRQLGRHPRIPFTSHQLAVLEEKFQKTPYLSSEEVIDLSKRLQLADIRVKIWFQNRRARERRERLTTNQNAEGESAGDGDDSVPATHQKSPPQFYDVLVNSYLGRLQKVRADTQCVVNEGDR